jgi:hypothetical protein
MELHQNWRINYLSSPRLEVSPHGPGPKLGPYFFEAKKDPGRLKPGLSRRVGTTGQEIVCRLAYERKLRAMTTR